MQSFNQLVDSYNCVKNNIQRTSLKIKELRELGEMPKAGNEGMPRGSGPSSPTENFVYMLCDLEEKRKILEEELLSIGSQISTYIDKIPNYTIQRIVEHKICLGGSWEKIAQSMFFSKSRVRQLYKDGVTFLNKQKLEAHDEMGKNDSNAV